MIGIFFRKDFRDNFKTWIFCLAAILLLLVSTYTAAAKMQINGDVVFSQTYTMFVALIPLIYLIKAGNSLVAAKVDDGSFFLDMVGGYKRKNIILTKMAYYIGSLTAMYLLIFLAVLLCRIITPWEELSYRSIFLLNTMAFLLNLSLSSVIFFASSFFNSSKNSMLVGAGIPLLSYAFNTIAGMFVNIPGLEDNTIVKILTKLKYLSFHTLFSYDDILAASSYNWVGVVVFLCVTIAFYTASVIAFTKKDLPL